MIAPALSLLGAFVDSALAIGALALAVELGIVGMVWLRVAIVAHEYRKFWK